MIKNSEEGLRALKLPQQTLTVHPRNNNELKQEKETFIRAVILAMTTLCANKL